MLFRVKSELKNSAIDGREFFDLNPGAEAIEEFNRCTSRQMFFVCLVADRDQDSPLRTLPELERRTKAAEIAGWPLEDGKRLDKNGRNLVAGKVESVETAIAKYRELQYDENEDMLQAVNAQIQEAIYMMKANKEELCTVVSKKTYKSKDGSPSTVEETKRVDGKMLVQMIKDSMKLGAELAELKQTREKLIAMIPKTNTVMSDLTTYTSNDFKPEELGDTEQSTVDIFMAKKREQE